jgi:DNA-binding transcriptional LysR family regulator
MDLNFTLAFVAVVRAGSFTAAGRQMGTPKSTLSKQVSRLEARLGTRLLQRTTRRLNLTETGNAYYQRCLQAIEDIENAERVALDVAGTPKGKLRVTSGIGLARVIGPFLGEFHERYPDIEFEFHSSQETVDLVAEGFDVAIRGGPTLKGDVVARKLGDDRMVFVASPAYIEKHGQPRTLDELADHPLISIGPMPSYDGVPFAGPDGVVPTDLRPWLVSRDFEMVHAAALGGAGIGLMVTVFGAEDLKAGRLVRVLPDYRLDGGGAWASLAEGARLRGLDHRAASTDQPGRRGGGAGLGAHPLATEVPRRLGGGSALLALAAQASPQPLADPVGHRLLAELGSQRRDKRPHLSAEARAPVATLEVLLDARPRVRVELVVEVVGQAGQDLTAKKARDFTFSLHDAPPLRALPRAASNVPDAVGSSAPRASARGPPPPRAR